MLRVAFASLFLSLVLFAQGPGKTPAADIPTVRFGPTNYEPEGITIQAGQTVRFVNSSDFIHTVTDLPRPTQKDTGSARGDELPAGAQSFDSGEIQPQQTWEHKFTTKGTYRFHCRLHEMERMSGTVIVK
jgi:plastocyanin